MGCKHVTYLRTTIAAALLEDHSHDEVIRDAGLSCDLVDSIPDLRALSIHDIGHLGLEIQLTMPTH